MNKARRYQREAAARRAGRYVFGNPHTRFALMRYPIRRCWSRPAGGLIVGRLGIWWSR